MPITVAAETLHVTGCGVSKKAYLEKALSIYADKHDLLPRLSGGGASKGIRLAGEGIVDLGASCRQRLADIGGNIHEKEQDIKMIQVAWDALVLIVNKENSINDLSQGSIVDLFKGNISNWRQLGGQNLPISILTRKGKDSGVGYMARQLIFGDRNFEFNETVFVYDSTTPLEKNVLKRRGSIALDGISSAMKIDVKILSIDGIYPTKENISSGVYPFFRPLYLAVNKHNKQQKVKGFIDFILGPQGQKIISNEGAINLEEGKALLTKWELVTRKLGSK